MPTDCGRPPLLGAGAVAAAALSLAAATAAAQPATEPIRIRFAAAPGCPDGDAFTRQVWARTARARHAAEGEAARTLKVEITAAPGRFQGRLAVEDPAGPSAVREVGGASCDEVVSALALIAALTIDPQASTAPTPPSPTPPAPQRTTPALQPPAPAPQRTTPAPQPPAPAPQPTPRRIPVTPPRISPSSPGSTLPGVAPPEGRVGGEAPSLAPALRVGVGGQAAGVVAIAPTVTPGVFLFGDVAWIRDGLLAPTVRLGALLATSEKVRSSAGTGRFTWAAAHLEGCPLRIRSGPLSIVPCALLEVGVLTGQGAGDSYAREIARPWVAPGILGRAEFRVVEGLSLEAQGALTFPLVRDTFYLEPATTLHDVPALGGAVGGGLLVHFP